VKRGDIYRTSEAARERGNKPGFYVIVSRSFVAQNEDIETVVCAPVYGEILGIDSECVVGEEEGLPRTSAVRCDFLTLLLKRKLTQFVGAIPPAKVAALDRALAYALSLPMRPS
jgi:mRNA-degrading endonuclease toxin of MazEF toxin-antitoxin module